MEGQEGQEGEEKEEESTLWLVHRHVCVYEQEQEQDTYRRVFVPLVGEKVWAHQHFIPRSLAGIISINSVGSNRSALAGSGVE